MYFEITPKTTREDLYGMEYILDTFISSINDKDVRLIVIKGLRRTGKTSLLNTALMQIKQKYVKIDVRESPHYDRKEFMIYLIEKIKTELGESIFQKIIKKISGVNISYKDFSTTFYLQEESNFFLFFETLNQQLKEKKNHFVLAFDEVQLIHKIHFDEIFAAIYDNYKHIKLIITCSEIGLLDRFLGRSNADSSLFGRPFIDVETKRLASEHISEFLAKGFIQINKEIHLTEIREVIETLDGIIGWATHYGWLRSKNNTHQTAMKKIIEEGTTLAKKEFDNFLLKRKRVTYMRVLQWISRGYNRWALLKAQFLKNNMKISDRQLQLYLKELQNYSFIEKVNEVYAISDPLLARAALIKL